MNVFDRLRNHWMTASVPLAEPATCGDIEALERRHGVAIPPDFREYLLVAGGMPVGVMDEQLLSFASLEALGDESRWSPGGSGLERLAVADFLLFSHWYVIEVGPEPGSGPVFGTHDGEELIQVAPTFTDFIEAYLADPERVADDWECMADAPANK